MPSEAHKKEDVKRLILEVLEVPTLSTALSKILKVAGNDRSNASDLAEVISKDQLLTANILKIANSAYFGLSQQVPTVSRAIVVLGFDAVKSIALSTSIICAFPVEGTGHDGFDRSKFWTHSLACAYLSKTVAGMTHRAEMETAFVCGLLHDIGKIVLDVYFPDSYRTVLARLAKGDMTSMEAEGQILGFTHAEVGMWIAQRWKFPKPIVFSIANHHGIVSNDARYRELTEITCLANHLCLQEGVCLPDQARVEPFDDSIAHNLKLNRDDLSRLRDVLVKRKESFVSFFSDWDSPAMRGS